jgi:hypothetical protein
MPRYICIESALTTSPSNRLASSIAKSLLPAAVGPTMATTGGRAGTHPVFQQARRRTDAVGERTSAVPLPDRNQIPDAERGIFVEQLGVERGISCGTGEHLPRRPAGGSKLRPQCRVERH